MQLRSRGSTELAEVKRPAVAGFCSLIFVLTACLAARGQDTNQFYLAAQYDWGQARGFFFVVEGAPQGNHAATIRDAKLTLGVGDGHGWHFASGRADFVTDTPYHVSVSISNGLAGITLDGHVIGQTHCGFAPAGGDLMFDQTSNIMRAGADYQVTQQNLHIGSGDIARDLISTGTTLPAQLTMLNPAMAGGHADMRLSKSVTLETTFQFSAKPSLKKLAPFIDQYGQCIQADWPGKVHSDNDLKSAQQIEAQKFTAWGTPADRDVYGGITSSGWSDAKTGFFHLARHDGKWWLITPLGNPCFYTGLCNAPGYVCTPFTGREYLFSWLPDRSGPFADALFGNAWHVNDGLQYVSFHTANSIREFGPDWRKLVIASAVRRARYLGFSGFGKWSDGDLGVSGLPVIENHGPNLAGIKHPDVFDPNVRREIVQGLRDEIERRKNDPWLVGWSVGNEKDEDITADEIRQIMQMDNSVPAHKALAGLGSSRLDDTTVEKLREYYEQAYYAFLYKTVKTLDPNHLYFGNWVTPNWWENENDWKISAANCDVVGFDWYADRFHAAPAGFLIGMMDKPVLCGEFSFPPTYAGQRGFGTYGTHTTTETESGQKYAQWIHDAASDPHCVGAFYFQYRDEPITGRGPGNSRDTLVVGEDYAFGLVDETDRIKWDFAEQVRKANLGATAIRLGAEK
jgi:hypothetical protein